MRNLNTTLGRRAEAFERGTTGVAFSKLSQNVASGVRAMKVQEEREKSEQQMETVQNYAKQMNSIDSNLDSIDSIAQNLQAKVLEALNQSGGPTKRETLAKEIASYKEQMLQFANAQYAGQFMFSNTNNKTAPFTVDNEKLCYNGIPMENIRYDDTTKEYYYVDPNAADPEAKVEVVPESKDVYVDLGLGIKIDNNMAIDERSAFKVSFSGMDVFGFGKPVKGAVKGNDVPSNLYDVLTEVEHALTDQYDLNKLADLSKQLTNLNDKMRLSRVDLGTRMNFVERTEKRLSNDIAELMETESTLISADPAKEAINLKQSEYSWMAVLQLGNKLLPTSLLDFMR